MIRTTPRNKNGPFLEATSNGQSSIAGLPTGFQDLCSYAMDRALGVEEASLSAAVNLNSCLFDIYINSFGLTPALGTLFDAVAKTFAFYTDLQMTWLVLLVPQAKVGAEILAHFAGPDSLIASGHDQLERDVENSIGRGKAA